MWQQWTNGILGLLLILIPFLNLPADGTMTFGLVVTSAIIALLGFWGATMYSNDPRHKGMRRSEDGRVSSYRG